MTVATTRDRIIEATLELITQHGLSSVTMIEIARTAGIARATLYNHYPDVPGILADAANRHSEQAITGLHQQLAVAHSPTETIEQITRYVAAISTHGHTLTTHHGLPPELRNQLSAFDDELEHQIRQALTGGRASGEFRSSLDLDTTARLVRHMLNGVSELVSESPCTAAHVTRAATMTVLAAIASPPAPAAAAGN